MLRNGVLALTIAIAGATSAQGDARSDSLLALLDSTHIDTVQMHLLLEAGDALTGSEQAMRLNDRLGALCSDLMKSGDPAVREAGERGYAEYLLMKGNELAYKLDLSGAVRVFRQADAIGERKGLGEVRESAMLGMAMAYYEVKNEAQAMKACQAASDMAWARGDTLMVIRLARRTMARGDTITLKKSLALIDAFAAGKQPQERTRILWQRAGLLSQSGRYAEAIAVARACGSMLDDPHAEPYLAPAYYLTLGDCYRHADSLASAVKAYERCMDMGEAAGAWSWSCSCGDSLGDVLLAMGDRAGAERAYKRVLRAAQANDFTGDVAYVSKPLLDIYRSQGRDAEAWAMQDIWTRARDSLDVTEGRAEIAAVEFKEQMLADSLANATEKERLGLKSMADVARERNRRNIFLFCGVGVLLLAVALWSRLRYTRRAKSAVEKAHARSESLLLNILPEEVAEELKNKGEAQARDIDDVSILFTDFKGFAAMSEQLTAQELVAEINTCFKAFDGISGKHGVEKIKTIGDAYMAAGGLPVPSADSAHNTVLAALEMQAFMKTYGAQRTAAGKPAFTMRVGIHTGPVVAGIVGVKKFQYDIWGDTVNIANRMESSGEVGQVNISEATYALVKEEPGLTFTPRGKVQAKGKGEMDMYFVIQATT